MSRPTLLEKAKDLRSHIVKAIIQQQDKELLKELMEDSHDDDDEEEDSNQENSADSISENSATNCETKKKSTRTAVLVEAVKSEQKPEVEKNDKLDQQKKNQKKRNRAPKWIVGYNDNSPKNNQNSNDIATSSSYCCATCDLVLQIHRVLDHSHLLAIPQICLHTLSNLIDFVNLERTNINYTQGNEENEKEVNHIESRPDDKNPEKGSSAFVTSSPRCENHEKILLSILTSSSTSDPSPQASAKQFIEELLDHHLSKVCASLWASIWRKHVEVSALHQMENDEPQQQRQQNNNSNDHRKSTKIPSSGNTIGIDLISKQEKMSQKNSSAAATSSPFTLFAPETDLLIQIAKFLSSLVIPSSLNLQQKISVDFTKSKLFQPLFSFMESVEILKSRRGQNENSSSLNDGETYYFFNLNCWLYQLCINIEEAMIVVLSSLSFSPSSQPKQLAHSASILRIMERKFLQDFVHGNFFSTSLNSQYSKLLDSNSKFWGSYIKNVIVASNGNSTSSCYSNAEIENDFILVSHPFVWFIQELSNGNNNNSNNDNFLQQEVHSRYLLSTLLWFRSWLLVSPVNKFGMPQKFGDSVWFVYHLRRLFSSKSMSTMRIIDDVCFDILSIVMLQYLPITMIEEEFLKNSNNPQQDGRWKSISEIMILFDSSCSSSAADNEPFHFGLVESSTFVIHLQKTKQFVISEVLTHEHFWNRSCGFHHGRAEIHFQDESNNVDQMHHDHILLLPSLTWIQNETSSFTSMPSPSIGFVNKKFVNFVSETNNKRKLTIFDLVVFTRFEYFENTYPMPNDDEKKSAENLLAKRSAVVE